MSDWKRAGKQTSSTDRTWDPQLEKTIEGVYVEQRSITKKDGKITSLYILKLESGELVGVWSSAVLENRFEEIPVGNLVKITYVGTSTQKNGNKLKNFVVEYKPNEVETDDEAPF